MPTREDVPIQPRTEWTYSRQEFEKALGIPDDQHVTSIYVNARDIKVITHPGKL